RSRLRQEIIAIEARATQGDVDLSGRQRARVVVHHAPGEVLAFEAAATQQRELVQCALHAWACCRARTTLRSLNGRMSPPTSWYSSWPLPATSTTSPAPACAIACAIAARRSRITVAVALPKIGRAHV